MYHCVSVHRYHECFADSGKLQLVMEWADGGDLASVIERHAKAKTYMPEDQVLGYFVQLIAALAHVHGVGIMHRDIKTNNVFMTSQGLLKLGDFGISKVRRTVAGWLGCANCHKFTRSRQDHDVPGNMFLCWHVQMSAWQQQTHTRLQQHQ